MASISENASPTQSSEHSRLLDPDADGAQIDSGRIPSASTASSPSGFHTTFKYCLLLEFFVDFAEIVLTVPLLSLLQWAICVRHYRDSGDPIGLDGGSFDQDLCMIVPVQRSLARLRGGKAFFETVAAIAVAIPIGRIADTSSHRHVFAVTITGILLSLAWTISIASSFDLPIQLVYASSVFLLAGGGLFAAEMLISVMVAGSCSEARRTQGFYYIYSLFIFTELITPPIASWAQQISIWLPIGMGAASLLMCFPVLVLMPETRHPSVSNGESSTYPSPSRQYSTMAHMAQLAKFFVNEMLDQFTVLSAYYWDKKLFLSVPIFFVGTFRAISLRVLLQYAHTRFGWKLSQTNALLSEVAVVNLALFLLVLPVGRKFFWRYVPDQQAIDLGVVRISLLLLALGSLCIALSFSSTLLVISTMIYALGFGARSTLLSLTTFWAAPESVAALYSAIFLVEQIGMLVGEPLLQNALALALDWPPAWRGLPFFCSVICYSISFLCALKIVLNIKRIEP